MKKISIKIVISILMFFCVTTNFFAVGAGFTVGATPSIAFDTITEKQDISTDFLFSAAGNIRGSRFPFVFAMGIEAGLLNNDFSLGANLNFDYWVIDSQLKNTWSIYSGCGLAANILFDFNSNMNFGFGPKFFVGVNKTFYDGYLELFAQLNAVPFFSFDNHSNKYFAIQIPVQTGLRFHF